MRIVSGRLKGIRFSIPKKFPSRPTTDFAKEALFNILQHSIDIEDMSVLDLFAGTGNISYEFASRYAKKVVSVEQNYSCIKFMREMIKQHEMDAITPNQAEVFSYLNASTETFDLIFADPPYDFKKYPELVKIILEQNKLKEGGLFILEHGKEWGFSDVKHFSYLRNYGGVQFSFFEIENE